MMKRTVLMRPIRALISLTAAGQQQAAGGLGAAQVVGYNHLLTMAAGRGDAVMVRWVFCTSRRLTPGAQAVWQVASVVGSERAGLGSASPASCRAANGLLPPCCGPPAHVAGLFGLDEVATASAITEKPPARAGPPAGRNDER
jgi:hypothetical protein